jgi:Family of unknown function (DUF6064)
MKPPFTLEQFLGVFQSYNQAVFPMQIAFYLVSIFTIYLVLKPNAYSDKIISAILAFLWLWMGIVYHLIYFTEINKLAYGFGVFFIVQSLLFMLLGAFKGRFRFRFQKDIYRIMGLILILFALIIYPILGYFFEHIYPSSPTFGLPCPTTIFTFGILLFNEKKCPILILIIPFMWSIIGFMAAFQFGILEDTGLIVASLMTMFLLMYKNKLLLKNDKSIHLKMQ